MWNNNKQLKSVNMISSIDKIIVNPVSLDNIFVLFCFVCR